MKSALDAALVYLSARALTCYELNQRLIRKGYSPEEIEEAFGRLKEWGYLNDEKYAESFIQTRKTKQAAGKIEFQLERRGIPQELTERKLAENYLTEEELALCLKEGQKLWLEESRRWESSYQFKKSYARVPRSLVVKHKVGQKLMHKGFASHMVFSVLEKLQGRDE